MQDDTRTNHSSYSTGTERDLMFVDFWMYYGRGATAILGNAVQSEEQWNEVYAGTEGYVSPVFRHVVAAKRSKIWMYLGGHLGIPIINLMQGWD